MTVPLAAVKAVRGARKATPNRRKRRTPRAITPSMPKHEVDEELEARKADAAWAARERAAGRDPDVTDEPATDGPPPASPGGGPSAPAMPAAASTGSGFLLGVFTWALALAYLQGGGDGVKKFLRAKFFNQT